MRLGTEPDECPEKKFKGKIKKRTYLVEAGGVVEFAQRYLVAVGHVIAPTEEHQGAAVVRQGAPVHVYTTLILGRESDTAMKVGAMCVSVMMSQQVKTTTKCTVAIYYFLQKTPQENSCKK